MTVGVSDKRSVGVEGVLDYCGRDMSTPGCTGMGVLGVGVYVAANRICFEAICKQCARVCGRSGRVCGRGKCCRLLWA